MAAGEEAEVWTRWKRGESCRAIGRMLDRDQGAICSVVAARGGMPPPRGRGPAWRCACRSARSSRTGSPGGSRCGKWAIAWAVPPRPSAGRCGAMAAGPAIARRRRILGRGPGPVGRSRAGSRARWPCARWWRRHPRSTGHRSRSRGGSDRPSPPIRSCTCRTRRSTRSLFVQSRGVLKLAATVASTGCTRHGQWTACCGGGPVSSRVTGRDGEGRIRLLTPDAREARVR